jgi:hypothetical protein
MADDASERAPLLHEPDDSTSDRRANDEGRMETTPLLSSSNASTGYAGEEQRERPRPNGAVPSRAGNTSSKEGEARRWRIVAALMLVIAISLTAGVTLAAIFVPDAVEEYAKQAAVVEPTNLSLESITTNGIRARIQANVRLDGSRVKDERTRRIGQVVTWLVGGIQTEQTAIRVHLPDYSNALLGTATVPGLSVALIDGQNNAMDFVAELLPGDAEGIRDIANEWLEGRLDNLKVRGEADLHLKSGIFPLGTHTVSQLLTFEGQYLYRSFASLYFGEKGLF